MSVSTVAKVYAEALFTLATERGQREALDQEFRDLLELVRNERAIADFFASPGTPSDDKLAVIEESIAPHVDPVTANFLRLLVQKSRETALVPILEAYQERVDRAEGRVEVRVTAAEPLDEGLLNRIANKLGEVTGQRIDLRSDVDPELIGGLRIRMGDRLLDASLQSRLRQLRERALES
jgi:F-type H+-transporting ATPase subunit delta